MVSGGTFGEHAGIFTSKSQRHRAGRPQGADGRTSCGKRNAAAHTSEYTLPLDGTLVS